MTHGIDVCEWCGHERSPRKKATCSPAHRAARWRWLNDVHTVAGAPEPPPWAGSPLHGRRGEESRANTCLMLPILDASQESALTAVAAHYLAVTQWVLGEGADGYPQAERAEIIRRREVCTLITGGAQ